LVPSEAFEVESLADTPIVDIHTLKEIWERVTASETSIRTILKCNDITKEKLDSVKEEAVALSVRIEAIRDAINLSFQNIDARLDATNEFRGQLKDQASTFLSRGESQIEHEALDKALEIIRDEVKTLELSKAKLEGKASQNSVVIAYIIAIVSLSLSAMALFLH